jgi:hypothetical protein
MRMYICVFNVYIYMALEDRLNKISEFIDYKVQMFKSSLHTNVFKINVRKLLKMV